MVLVFAFFRRPLMVLKNVFAAIISATLVASGGACFAADYKPGDFLGLDLSKAVLSPKPLGPPTQFAPVPIEAESDSAKTAAQARAEPKAAPHITVAKTRTAHVHTAHVLKTREAHARVKKPRGAARTRLAHRHSNPLDAEAFDRRIQVWPCRTGGICNWQR
jgi:hypothetical protein